MLLTSEQDTAITTRDVSVALSAGAGCGKTFVLTERFLSYVDPEQATSLAAEQVGDLVAITFTEAAAREMRGRIRAKCLERMARAKGKAVRAWWDLSRRLDTARISTIHGFCRSLLAEHAIEAGLDPQFRVLDDAGASLLRLAVVDDFLRQKLSAWDEGVFRLFAGGRIEGLRENLLELLSRSSSPAFREWRGPTPEALCEAWQRAAATSVPVAVGRNVAHSAAATRFRALAAKLRVAPEAISTKCFDVESLLDELERGGGSPKRLEDLRQLAYFKDIANKKLWAGEWADFKAPCQKALGDLRERVGKSQKSLQFDSEAALPAAADGLSLLRLAHEADEHYRTAKSQQAAVDFDDLIDRAAALLASPEHAAILDQVRQNTFALLVDEFQDTDRRQLDLVQAICGERLSGGKLFFVGDRKQSIYRFRGAQPQVFHELADQMPESGRQALTKNFRSQPAILDFVNALFVHEFAPDYEQLVADRSQVSPRPAVEFLWTRPGGSMPFEDSGGATHDASIPQSAIRNPQSPKLKVEDVRRAEAASIAKRLREMLEEGEPIVWDDAAAAGGTPRARPLKPGDIAILFRSLGDVHFYESALRAEGLDYYLVGGHAFYAQQEIHDFVNLLRSVASEADDVALAGALRSPIFALLDETLFWLVQKGGSLRKGLDKAEQIVELALQERAKATRAAATLDHLRHIKDRESITCVVRTAIERTGYDAVLLGEFLGERKLANLNKLVDAARAADASGADISDFVTQLTHFVAKLPKEALAATSPESADVIRLMTIHQSKGLEFPLVVVPDLNRGAGGSKESVALHDELGPVVRPSAHPEGTRPGEKTPVVGLDLYRVLEQDEDRAESLRVLYVACTRAADYLMLSSGFEKQDQAPGELLSHVARNFDLDTGKLLRELPDAYVAPEIRVTTCPLNPKLRQPAAGVGSRLKQVVEELGRTGFHPVSGGGKSAQLAKESHDWTGWKPVLPPEVLPLSGDLAPREFSFSRLSGMLHVNEPESDGEEDRPVLETPGPASPRDSARDEALALGQLVHAVLEVLPLDGRADVRSLVARHAQSVLAAKDEPYRQQVVERAEKFVARVVNAPRHRELLGARQVCREIEFVLHWPPQHPHPPALSPIQGEGEKRRGPMEGASDASLAETSYVIRGVVDCMYEVAEGNWRIVDYKTNRMAGRALSEVAAPYKMQLRVYALALEQIMGVSPQELVLWFLDSNEQYAVDWDATLRCECIDAVNRAIRSLVPSC